MNSSPSAFASHLDYELFKKMMHFTQSVVAAAKRHYPESAVTEVPLKPCLELPIVDGVVLVTRDKEPCTVITPWGRTTFIHFTPGMCDIQPEMFLHEICGTHHLVELNLETVLALGLDPNLDEEAFLVTATDKTVKDSHSKIVLHYASRPPREELRDAWQRCVQAWMREPHPVASMSESPSDVAQAA